MGMIAMELNCVFTCWAIVLGVTPWPSISLFRSPARQNHNNLMVSGCTVSRFFKQMWNGVLLSAEAVFSCGLTPIVKRSLINESLPEPCPTAKCRALYPLHSFPYGTLSTWTCLESNFLARRRRWLAVLVSWTQNFGNASRDKLSSAAAQFCLIPHSQWHTAPSGSTSYALRRELSDCPMVSRISTWVPPIF